MHEEVIEGFRLSPQQRRLWRQQSADAAGAYVAQAALLVEGALRPGLLRAAVGEVVARHEILRTGYLTPPEMSAALQVIGEPRLDWREDARAWPSDPDEQQSELASLLAEARREPFDLARGPVLRAHLFELDGGHHLLIYTLPALAADTRTLETLSDEIAGAYDALVRGEAREGEPLQYADLSEWQNELLEAEEGSPGREFWRRHATGATRPLRLPADEPDAEADARGPRLVRAPLDARLTARLRALAESRGCTVRAVLLAGWQTLLWRLSGEPEASCRVLFDGRQYAEMENALGLCARYLPVGARLGTELQFGELVADVEARLGEAARYQEYFIEEEAAPREAGSGGLSVGFEFRRWPPARRAAGLAYTFLALSSRFERLDLGLSCAETEDSISVELHYDPRALRAGAAERLARSLHALLQGAAEGPHLPLGRLNILDEAERARLLYDFNRTAADVADDLCVHRLFERQAGQTPEATAVVFKDARLTYRELDERAERLARRLRARGVAPEAAVGLCAERSVEMVVGILAVLKAGGAYLPLDPSYPRERLGFMLEDTRVPVLLAERRLLPNLPAHAAQVVCFDEEADEAESEPLAPAREPAPDNAAYVIYTSGSTGKPKGVVVTHRNLAHSTAARALYYRSPVESFLLTSSFAFDSSVAGIFWTLCHGGALVLPEEDGHRDVARLAELLCAHRVSHMLTLPSVYALLLEHAQAERLDLTATFIVAGDACPPELVERHREAAPRAGLFNEYGPTECTVWSTVHDCLAPGRAGATVPIGRPIANARVYLLGGGGEPAPAGAPGELYIGGAGLARGYLDRPALTAERFVPDPFSPEPGARLYRTGDVARHLGGGAIEFLGRADSQVKVRGFRVELAEVESVLERHPGVRESVVLARADGPAEKRLVAYFVTGEGAAAPGADELREFVRERLPDYMTPAAFVRLAQWPLMPNGKIDRKALPAPEAAAGAGRGEYVAPRGRAEEVIASIWADVLGLERVGVRDNFFALGGDSIRGIQVVARANRAGLRLTPQQLFRHQTVAELAAVADAAPAVRAEQGEATGDVPLTPVQHWFFSRDLPEPHHFNQSVLLDCPRGLDHALLGEAVRLLLAHHDALRLRFERTDAGWRQFYAPAGGPLPVARVDVPAMPEAECAAAVEAAVAHAQASLDLSHGPVVRFTHFRSDGGPAERLHIAVHHLAVDGVSWRVLLEDLGHCYERLSEGLEVRLPPKTTSYRHWAERLADYAQSEALRQEAAYWPAAVGPFKDPLPRDLAGADEGNTEGAARAVAVGLGAEETRALVQDAPRLYRVGVEDVLVAALARGFRRWTGSDSLLLCLESHGRQDVFADVDLSRTVGWFTSHYPLRLQLPAGGADAGAELKAVKEQLRGVPNHGLGYGLLRHLSRDAETRRQLEAMPRPEVLFNYLGSFDEVLAGPFFRLSGHAPGHERSPAGRRDFLLEINAHVLGGRLSVEWTYGAEVHRRETVERLAADFLEELRRLVEHCRTAGAAGYTPSDFRRSKLNQAELDQVLARLMAPGERPA